MTIAFHTLGCKVNQYDTQAMRELFLAAGYEEVPLDARADVYLINTCTVTGTGASKSMKAVRGALARNKAARVIIAGCLAQQEADKLLLPGVTLVIGTRQRAHVVELFERAVAGSAPVSAVETWEKGAPFESMRVNAHEGRTRAVLKIEEGCANACAYCIIPSVRGPVRSMPLDMVALEAAALKAGGYGECVLTGIHLNSYGDDLDGASLPDAVERVAQAGFSRIRLGSLDPARMDEGLIERLARIPALCAQFHLSLQSGSASVLGRMARRYTPGDYERVCTLLRAAFPRCAITTDIICGFPGETGAEHSETLAFIEHVCLARVHAFPFSPREGTPAASMPQLPAAVAQARARELIALSDRLERTFAESFVGSTVEWLPERCVSGVWSGYTREYVRVCARHGEEGRAVMSKIAGVDGSALIAAEV